MKKFIYLLSVIALAFVSISPVAADHPTTNEVAGHTNFFTGRHVHNSISGTTSNTSENWAGYAVTGNNGAFNSVTSSWTQPTLNCAALPETSYSSYWVGLDGFNDQTVEQIGTEANCSHNQASYSAWYEMYPSNPYEVTVRLPINPGNVMSATVNYTPATTTSTVVRGRVHTVTTNAVYTLTLLNKTTGGSYTTNIASRQSYYRSSAEVITEAPYSNGILPLADFVSTSYSGALVNGSPMGSFSNLQSLIMDNPAGMVATPSAFDSTNKNFNVTWSD